MIITRRGLLSAALASMAAPAIVRAESLMPIWVPKTTLIGCDFGVEDFTIETCVPSKDGRLITLTATWCDGRIRTFLDGVEL